MCTFLFETALRTQQHAYMIKMIMQSLYHLQNRMKKLENMTQNTTEYPENVEFPALGQYPLTGSHGQTHHQPTQMPVQQSVPTATGMGYGGTGKSKWAKSPQNLSLAAFMDADTSKTMKTDPNGLPDVVTSDYWSTLNNLVENGKHCLNRFCHPNRVPTPVPYTQPLYAH